MQPQKETQVLPYTLASFELQVATTSGTDIIDITATVSVNLAQVGLQQGMLMLFTPGSTAALTTIEYEPGVIQDLKDALDRLIPTTLPYQHDRRWGDGNGYSHVRAALMKPSVTIPVTDGRLLLGTWQQIVLLDFDNRPRQRRICGQALGLFPPAA